MPGSTSPPAHPSRRLAFAAAAVFALSFGCLGCRPPGSSAGDASPPSGPEKCTRIGQTCEFSPNKLGSCVLKDNCAEDCLVCQSQH
jgi:hypothetical protein